MALRSTRAKSTANEFRRCKSTLYVTTAQEPHCTSQSGGGACSRKHRASSRHKEIARARGFCWRFSPIRVVALVGFFREPFKK